MLDVIKNWLPTLGGLLVFGAAYYIHQKVRLTRFACVLALLAGFMVYNGQIGSLVNRYAAQVAIITFCAVIIGIAVIVADVKGKRKGADRPALFAFFAVPVFLVSFLAAAPAVLSQSSEGIQKVGNNVQQQADR